MIPLCYCERERSNLFFCVILVEPRIVLFLKFDFLSKEGENRPMAEIKVIKTDTAVAFVRFRRGNLTSDYEAVSGADLAVGIDAPSTPEEVLASVAHVAKLTGRSVSYQDQTHPSFQTRDKRLRGVEFKKELKRKD